MQDNDGCFIVLNIIHILNSLRFKNNSYLVTQPQGQKYSRPIIYAGQKLELRQNHKKIALRHNSYDGT